MTANTITLNEPSSDITMPVIFNPDLPDNALGLLLATAVRRLLAAAKPADD